MIRPSLLMLLLWLFAGVWPGSCIPGLPPAEAKRPSHWAT